METYEKSIRAALAGLTGLEADRLPLEFPKKRELGDFAFPCFPLAKRDKKNPVEVAKGIVADWSVEGVQAAAAGPYVNFTVERTALARDLFAALTSETAFGSGSEGKGKTIVIDYSSPNIAKPFGIGHLRSTVIGAAIKRILEFQGYTCVGVNHLGDWGMQFGRMLAAVERHDPDRSFEQAENPTRALLDLYVRIHDEEESDPRVKEEARDWFRRLESGDSEAKQLWKLLIDVSLKEFDRIYQVLGVSFEKIQGESFYEDKLAGALERIEGTGITEVSDGALIVDLEKEGMAPCLLKTGEGTTLYATRDFAALFYRKETWNFHKALYVVGSDQRLHFRQLKAVLQKMGADWSEDVVHVDFGMMRFKEGKMSTRKGKVIFLDEVLAKARTLADGIIQEKNPDLEHREKVSAAVGVGAVIFNDLKNSRVKDVVFDWDTVLNFDGETGPYVQYTHARLCSILRKHGEPVDYPGVDVALLSEGGGPLLALLSRFPQYLARAATEFEPSILTGYLLEVAKTVNLFYQDHRVLGEKPEVTRARVALVDAARSVLERGLALLGIGAPQEM